MSQLNKLLLLCICTNYLFSNCEARDSSDTESKEKDKNDKDKKKGVSMTDTGTLGNVLTQISNMPVMETGRKFRSPCRTGNKCGKLVKRLMVPKLAQLENTIMGIMKELEKLPPGARVPEKQTKTDPQGLMQDGMYKEPLCEDKLENCIKEDKRRKRILRRLFFKKYNSLRQKLIGYGGRDLWGGEANLFYKK